MTISESDTKKRGRPPAFKAEQMAIITQLFPEVHSRRGRVNALYRTHAMDLLKQRRFRWLMDMEGLAAGKDTWKPSILAELGRIADDRTLRAFAARICQLKPKTHEAVAMIRRARLNGASKPATVGALVHELGRTIDDYRTRHPDLTWRQVRAAFGEVGELIDIAEQGE
jgi:hypothetical protein